MAFIIVFVSSKVRASDSETAAAAATDAHSLASTGDFLCCATEGTAVRWLLLNEAEAEAVAAAADTAGDVGAAAAEAMCALSHVGMCDTKRINTDAAGPIESSLS